jgi:hypothetical protein
MGAGLCALRGKGQEGIARVCYGTVSLKARTKRGVFMPIIMAEATLFTIGLLVLH